MMASMRSSGTAEVLQELRHLAVLRLEEGYSQEEVAEFLDVSRRTVGRWWHAWQHQGPQGLRLQPGRGRRCKLSEPQTEQVLDWLDHNPSHFGFPTEQWTAPRVAGLIQQRFGITMNPRYLNDWLKRHGVTPQMPQRQAQERNPQLIAGWIRYPWPRIKKRPGS